MKHEAWAINQSDIHLHLHTKQKPAVSICPRPTMAKQSENGEETYDLQKLRPEVDKLLEELDVLTDKPLVVESERKILDEISEFLKKIKEKIALEGDGKEVKDDDDDVLPRSKREELHNLVRLLRAALEERGAASSDHRKWPREQQDAADDDSKPATGCIPCKPRASKQQQQQQQSKKQQQQQQEQGEKDGVSLTLLLRLTKNVLEPEQYYEWTTSYVDEERIYGWDKEAGEVMDALVAPDDSERMFRAAGIAGIHGSGKTALAQKVFVHDRAKDNFALRLWVCVGPPDSEDRFNLLYRMLDNLGLDTAKVEDIVDKCKVVTDAVTEERRRMEKPDAAPVVDKLRRKVAEMVTAKRRAGAAAADRGAGQQNQPAAAEKADGVVSEGAGAGEDANKQAKEEEEEKRIVFEELLKEKIANSPAVEKSKIGVLLYILNMTLSKTSYMIVFDDIRAYRRDDDGDGGCWYSNLTLPPPEEGEWGDRLAYGLPKGEHRGAVLVTCRKEDDARTMARTGLVVRPPKLEGDDAWKLFRREYDQAKDDRRKKEEGGGGGGKVEEDLLLKQLEEMKKEIVDKCLGLPVAIIEAARGFAGLEPLPDLPDDDTASALKLKEAAAADVKPAPAGAAAAAAAAAGGHSHSRTESSEGIHQAEEEVAPAGPAEAADESE